MKMIAIVGAFLLVVHPAVIGQTDLTGYWKFSVPNGGTSYLELKQVREAITSALRGFMRSGLTVTLYGGKLHLEAPAGPPAENPALSTMRPR